MSFERNINYHYLFIKTLFQKHATNFCYVMFYYLLTLTLVKWSQMSVQCGSPQLRFSKSLR